MEDIKFDNMNVYLNLAKKIINKFAGSLSKEMLKSEDAISDVASAIMQGDWKWDSNRTGKTGQKKSRYSYRNQCAIWAIQTYATKKYKAPKKSSIDFAKDEDSTNIKDTIPSKEKDPYTILSQKESDYNFKQDLNDILNSDIISDRQRQFIKLYYFEGYTLEKVGRQFNITREAVRQNINKALESIRNLAHV
jgi:RNA polymerase sigma factor (sigma-70 family)